jgi:hypothetical protein
MFQLFFLAGSLASATSTSSAQMPASFVLPDAFVLYVHPDLRSTAFLDPLMCALRRVLVAPVSSKQIDLPLGTDLLGTRGQFDANKVAIKFAQATAKEGGPGTFKYLLLPYDLKAPNLNYVFAMSFSDRQDEISRGCGFNCTTGRR